MSDPRTPLFVECRRCGARWQVATTPVDIAVLWAATRNPTCPNCSATKSISLCPTIGADRVTAARDGQAMPR